jgi:hypothetical protein
MKPVTPLELYRATPRTNCRQCGFAACLAFATAAIVEKKSLDLCPFLDPKTKAALAERIAAQHLADVYVKRDLYRYTADDIRDKLREKDFAAVAGGIGAVYEEREGVEVLQFSYLNRLCELSRSFILLDGKPAEDPWDNILLYNYVYFAGREELKGEWIPIDRIPGHIPKKPELEKGCEEKIGRHFEGGQARLVAACKALGGAPSAENSNADLAFEFYPLPKVPFLLLFWDHVPEEGFPARVKVLFDLSVTDYLDIESLVFLAEKFAEALIGCDRP